MGIRKLAIDQGMVDINTKTITYIALPYPLPKAWQDEFKACAKNHKGDFARLEALEIRARATIGFEHTRKYIPPRLGEINAKTGSNPDNVSPASRSAVGW
jgi:hypothetical protein